MKEGWEVKKLGEVYDVRDGTHDSPKYQNDGYPLVTSKNLKNDVVNLDKVKYISEEDFININKRSKVDIGDVLFAMIGTIGNPTVITEEPNFAIKNVALFKVDSLQNSKFLKYYLESKATVDKMQKDAKGSTQKFVGLGYLRKFSIPIPPLIEQKQIVALLDQAFTAIDKAKTNIEKNIANAKELFQSKLNEIFSQKGDGWEEKSIIDLCDHKSQIVGGPFGSNLKVKDYRETGVPILRLQNIGKGYFIDKDIKFVDDSKAKELAYHSFESGDIVLAKLGIPIGKTCIVPDNFKFGIVVADVVRIRPNKKLINYNFLKHFLNSDNSVSQLNKDIRGATRPRVNIAEVRNLRLSVPKLDVQLNVTELIDKLETLRNNQISNYETKLDSLEELKKSILQKAFLGELTN